MVGRRRCELSDFVEFYYWRGPSSSKSVCYACPIAKHYIEILVNISIWIDRAGTFPISSEVVQVKVRVAKIVLLGSWVFQAAMAVVVRSSA